MDPVYSFVIPILDEAEPLPELLQRLGPVMDTIDGSCEVLLIDDGSTDESFEVMNELHPSDPRVRALRLSRNFGHQVAIGCWRSSATSRSRLTPATSASWTAGRSRP